MRSNDNCQKIKLQKLYEMLRQETDEEHPMRTNEICERLEQMGISCERRTLAVDIQTLNDFGFEVCSRRVGKGKGYFIEDRSFSLPELKVLIDAVQASNTITESKSDALIDKIAELGGSHRSALLKRNTVRFNTIKHTNESIYQTIDLLEKALRTNKKVEIVYFHLDENGEKIYHTEGGKHIVDPVSMIYDNNEYYLTCYDPGMLAGTAVICMIRNFRWLLTLRSCWRRSALHISPIASGTRDFIRSRIAASRFIIP